MIADDFKDLIGVPLEDARRIALDRGADTIRVRSVDGEARIGTADFRPKRLNVAIRQGRVSAVSGLG